jgi:hypothetical protein
MPFQPLNRFSAHADFSKLSPQAVAIGKEIAYRTNGTRPGRMKLSVRYLARQTRYSEPTTNKAINELIDKGYFSATQSNKRTGRVFTLLVACPAECKNKNSHYSKAEKQALIAIENNSQENAECVNYEPLSVEQESAECVTGLHTNRELNKEIKNLNSQTKTTEQQTNKTTEKTEVAEVVSVGLDDWVNLCLDTLLRIHRPTLKRTQRTRNRPGCLSPLS